MTARPASRRLRRRLGLSSALSTGLLLGMPAAHAQSLPVETDIASATTLLNAAATIDKSFTTNAVSIGLHDVATVIDWKKFDIPAGKSIGFTDARVAPIVPSISVLNRVVGSDAITPGTFVVPRSRIDGQLNAASNISVYLVNSSGILFGSSSAVNVGSLIASTQALRNADFLAGTLRFRSEDAQGEALTGAGIKVEAGATLRATGDRTTLLGQRSDLVLIGASVVIDAPTGAGARASLIAQTGDTAAASDGDVGIIAADDVTITSGPGSPLAVTIAKGTAVTGAFKVNGTISGRNVTLALATRDAVADNLLAVDGMVTATGATATQHGVVLSAGRAVTDAVTLAPAVAADIDAAGSASVGASLTSEYAITAATAGALTTRGAMSAANGDVAITAGGAVTVANTVSAGGDYVVQGTSVTIGKAGSTVAQSAAGKVDLTATTGGIGVLGTPTVQSNRANAAFSATNRGLFLDAVGAIDLAGSTLLAGTDTAGYSVQIRNNPGDFTQIAAVTLGNVTAHGIAIADGAHTANQTTTTSFAGDLTTGALTLSTTDFTIAGTAALGSLHTVSNSTQVTTTGAGHDLTIGAITLDANLATFSAAGALSLTSVTESGTNTGGVNLGGSSIAASGAVTVRGLTATTDGAATFSGAVVANAGPAAITAGGALSLAGLNANHEATLAASSITNSGATQALSLSATASGNIGLAGGIITNGGAATLAAGGMLNVADMLVSGTATLSGTDISATGALTVHDLSATASGNAAFSAGIIGSGGATLKATAGTLSVTGIAVSGAVILSGATVSGTGTIQGDTVSVTAAGNATIAGALATGGAATLTATAGTLTVSNFANARTDVTLKALDAAGDVIVAGIGTTNGSATVTAGRQATVTGDVTVKGKYEVIGAAVTLGGLQNAAGAVTITAERSITSTGAFGQIYANTDGIGDDPLTLRLTSTDPGVIPVLNLRAGPLLGLHGGSSAVQIELPRSDVPILLGTVSGSRLQSRIGATDPWIDGLTSTSTGGIRASSFELTGGPLRLTVPNGKLTVGLLTAASIALDVRELSATDITATAGSITISGRGGNIAAYTMNATGSAGDIIVDSSGAGEAFSSADLHAGRDVLIGQTHAFASTIMSGGTASAGRDFNVASSGTVSLTTAITAGRDVAIAAAGGALQLGAITTTGGDAVLTATAAETTISGPVSIGGGDYRVTGRSVLLGGTVTQQASGAITIEATGGMITGGTGLTLRSDTGGAGLRAVTLVTSGTTGGDIALSGTTLAGGPGRQSDVIINSRLADNAVVLGDVSAARLRGSSAGGALDEGIVRTAAIDVGNVDIGGDLMLTANGGALTAGALSGRSVTLASGALLSAAAISAGDGAVMIGGSGTLSVTGAVAANGSGGDIRIDRAGAQGFGSLGATRDIAIGRSIAATSVTLAGAIAAGGAITITGLGAGAYAGAVRGNGDVSVTGSALAFGTGVNAITGALSLSATNGNLTVPTVSAGTNAALLASNGMTSVTGPVSLPGDYSVTGSSVTLGSGVPTVQEARGAITITATGGTLTGRSGLTLHADTDGGGNQALTLATSGFTGGAIALAGTTLVSGNAAIGGAVQIRSRLTTSSVTLGDVTAGSLLGGIGGGGFATGLTRSAPITVGSITLGNALAGVDSTLRLTSTNGALSAGLLSSRGAVVLASGSFARVAGVSAGSIDISGSGALAADGALASTGGITINRGGAITLASLSAQTDIAIGQATAALSIAATGPITSTAGRISIRSSTAQVYGAALSARDAVRLDGGSVQAAGVTSTAGSIDIASGGATTVATLQSAGSVAITAGGAATVIGAVDVGGAYRVTGAAVLLGNGSTPVLQRAGSIIAQAKGGAIAGASGLTLRGDDSLVLDGAGGVAFDPASRLAGGDVGVRAGDGRAIALGVVSARRLTGADTNQALTATLAATGPLTFGGDVTTALTLDASSAGTFTTRRITVTGAGQDLVLAAGGPSGDLAIGGTLTAARNATLAAARNASFTDITATQGAASVTTGGTLTGISLTGGHRRRRDGRRCANPDQAFRPDRRVRPGQRRPSRQRYGCDGAAETDGHGGGSGHACRHVGRRRVTRRRRECRDRYGQRRSGRRPHDLGRYQRPRGRCR